MLKGIRQPAFAAALVVAVLAAVTFVDLPAGQRWVEVLQDAAHVPAFALVAVSLHRLARAASAPRRAPVWGAVVASIGATVLGALVEVAQHFLHRDASLGDVGRDACGAAGATALLLLLDRRTTQARDLLRPAAALTAAAAALIAVLPLIECARAYRHRHALFPVLADFRSSLDLYFLRPVDPPFARHCLEAAVEDRYCRDWALDAPYTKATWAGPVFEEMQADWRGQGQLCIEVSNPHPQPFTLVVALNDRAYSGHVADRYTGLWPVTAHERRTLCLPLNEIAVTPGGRRMDLGHIGRLAIAQDDADHQPGFRLHRVWLQ
jgi:VanZ family protein